MKPKEKKHQCIEGKGWACDKKKNIHVTTFQSTGDNNWRHYVEVWSEQGRSEDEIWAVNNFMTGQGKIMLDSLLQEAYEQGMKATMGEMYEMFQREQNKLSNKDTKECTCHGHKKSQEHCSHCPMHPINL